ncbi:hypothetical protein Lal_00016740 [Lupinus albus]|nr:hypothetical protein Lal_00016740 [Lupinus albus]
MCNKCGRLHYGSTCLRSGNGCFHCKELGHIKRFCPKLDRRLNVIHVERARDHGRVVAPSGIGTSGVDEPVKGGTLRDIPIGGGNRKNTKRSRTLHNNNVSNSISSSSTMTSSTFSLENLNVSVNVCSGEIRSFSSLLNNTEGSSASGFGHGFEEIEFEVGRADWSFPGMVAAAANISGSVAASGGGAFQLEGGEASYVGGRDYFSSLGLLLECEFSAIKIVGLTVEL